MTKPKRKRKRKKKYRDEDQSNAYVIIIHSTMWKRVSLKLRTLSSLQSTPRPHRFHPSAIRTGGATSSPASVRPSVTVFSRHFSTESVTKKTVEDVMPIATGHEREELEAELEGRRVLEINYPVGPFGTKEKLLSGAWCLISTVEEAPAVVKSVFDKRIVGCPGGEGEDEHDVVWFWLEKGKPHECPVCSQYFVLEVVGQGGPPDGHGDDDDEDHHH